MSRKKPSKYVLKTPLTRSEKFFKGSFSGRREKCHFYAEGPHRNKGVRNSAGLKIGPTRRLTRLKTSAYGESRHAT